MTGRRSRRIRSGANLEMRDELVDAVVESQTRLEVESVDVVVSQQRSAVSAGCARLLRRKNSVA